LKNNLAAQILDIEENSVQASNVRVSYDVEKVIQQFSELDYT